jgi:signal transduction histidine kinase
MVVRARAIAFSLAPVLAAAGLALAYATVRPLGGAYLYFPLTAVVAASLYGGLGPGFSTLALSLLGFGYLFLAPRGGLAGASSRDIHRLVEFGLAGLAAAWLCGRYRQARLAAEEAASEARRIGRLQERLLAAVSHDLNNPLAAVRAGLDLMGKLGPLDARQRSVVDRMRASARRMERLVADLLGFAHGRREGDFPVRRVETELGKICEAVVAEFRQTFPHHAIHLSVTGDDKGTLDPVRLEQVASNLLSNAIRHGDPAEPIEVGVVGLPGELLLAVVNRGSPIPPDLLPLVFEPFRSGPKNRGGLGLGLFVVKEIVAAHGGSVQVRSDPEATAFEVRLPRCMGEGTASVGAALARAAGAPSPRASAPPG